MRINERDISKYLNRVYGTLEDTPFLRAMGLICQNPDKVFVGKRGMEKADGKDFIDCRAVAVNVEWTLRDIHSKIRSLIESAADDPCCAGAVEYWLSECGQIMAETSGDAPPWLDGDGNVAPDADFRVIAEEIFNSDPRLMEYVKDRSGYVYPFIHGMFIEESGDGKILVSIEYETGDEIATHPLTEITEERFGKPETIRMIADAAESANASPNPGRGPMLR